MLGCRKLFLNCYVELRESIIVLLLLCLVHTQNYSKQKYLEWVRADDSNMVSSCCQGLHEGLERQLMTDGRCGKDSQDASSLGAVHCIQQQ